MKHKHNKNHVLNKCEVIRQTFNLKETVVNNKTKL